jgi:hypothetical protein
MRRERQIAKVAMARKLGVRLYWIVAQGMRLRDVFAVRFARGAARSRLWCEVDRHDTDWDAPLSSPREFEVVIMVAIAIG